MVKNIKRPEDLSVLTRKTPIGFSENDLANYANILDNGGATYQSKRGLVDKNSDKWRRIIGTIWEPLYPQKGKLADNKKAKRGSGKAYLSSNPDALVERLQLLFSSVQAGNTGIENKIVAILHELLRMKQITHNQNENIILHL